MAESHASALEVAADKDAATEAGALLPALAISASNEVAPLKCCCGSAECVFLRHSNSVLDSVEKDVHTAARMGQFMTTPIYGTRNAPVPASPTYPSLSFKALHIPERLEHLKLYSLPPIMGVSKSLTFALQALLARHEAYMADAERDRIELTSRIERLEMDNKELETTNARTIEENRALLDQLESLNSTVTDSEGRIKSLEATLLSSQRIIRRLEGETARAESLERQIAFLEQEQEQLQNTLVSSHEEARSSMARWQRAERGIIDLQEQLEKMEQESREECERHAEVMGRMEKQREVEKELNTAAGRLKGAAAAKTLNHGSNHVVSHFVRDLLQDNTNLQQGIMELREMLMNSNDEIQALREQLMHHQPLGDGDASTTPTLRAELDSKDPPERSAPAVSQELHIHHHYHVTPKPEVKKPRKKRQVLSPGVILPLAMRQQPQPSTPPTTTWRPTISTRTPRDSLMTNRLSVMSEQPSEFTPSSAPSSPQSNPRNSLFDPGSMDSWPASPTTSIDPMSPIWRGHRKHPSNMSARSFLNPTTFSLDSPNHTHTIIEEGDGAEEVPDLGIITDESAADDETSSKGPGTASDDLDVYFGDTDDDRGPARRLRRALSHESILSLTGGLDIHTLRAKPSQLTLRHITNATSITANSTVTAQPILSRVPAKRSSLILRESYSSSPIESLRTVSGPSPSGSSKLSSWVGWRPWKGDSAGASTPVKPRERQYYQDYGRSPGINQAGTIPGFHEYLASRQKRDPGKVMPDQVDHDALREGLTE
ncbi:hypothetical protein SCUP234_04031 [Seiridium cupressi]